MHRLCQIDDKHGGSEEGFEVRALKLIIMTDDKIINFHQKQ